MITLSSATRVFVVTGYTDMRKSFNGLYGIVAQQFSQEPTSGHVFVFCNRSRNRIKILTWDGSGLWVCAKRLEKGTFHWPWAAGQPSVLPDSKREPVVITHESLTLLLGGMDLKNIRNRGWYRNVETNS
jgi:transposase